MDLLLRFVGDRLLGFDALGFIVPAVITFVARAAWTRHLPSLRWFFMTLLGLAVIQFYVQPVYFEYKELQLEQLRIGVDRRAFCQPKSASSKLFHSTCIKGENIMSLSPFLLAHQTITEELVDQAKAVMSSWWTTLTFAVVGAVLIVSLLGYGVRRYEQMGIKRYGRVHCETLASRAAAAACYDPCDDGTADNGPRDF